MVQAEVAWYKAHRDILESDLIHGRRADARDLDWMLHVNPQLQEKGLLVVVLTPNGPAEKAGIRGSKIVRKKVQRGLFVFEHDAVDHSQSDLIVGIDGKKVKQSDDLLTVIEAKKPGDQVYLNVVRNGQIIQMPVILGNSE